MHLILCDAHTPERTTEKNRVVNLWITLWTRRPEWVVKLFCTNLGVINTKARVCPTVGLGNITLLVSWMLPDFGVTREVCVVFIFILDTLKLHYNCGSGGILVDILSTSAHKYPFEQTTRSILLKQ